MKRKSLSNTASIFYDSELQTIMYFCQDHQLLFDYCYTNKRRGQVIKKQYTSYEYMLLKEMTPELVKLDETTHGFI